MGVGYGVVKAFDALAPEVPPEVFPRENPRDSHSPPANQPTGSETVSTPEALRRLDGMEERLIRMEKSLEVLASPVERVATKPQWRESEHFVTRTELNLAIEQLSGSLESNIEHRFEVQNRSGSVAPEHDRAHR